VAEYASTVDSAVQEAVLLPDSIVTDIGDLEFTAASTAMVGLSGGMSYLFTYPYYCLEQRCSAILPVIQSKEIVEAFQFKVFHGRDASDVVNRTLEEIPAFQRERRILLLEEYARDLSVRLCLCGLHHDAGESTWFSGARSMPRPGR
jgi:hypothetical protein